MADGRAVGVLLVGAGVVAGGLWLLSQRDEDGLPEPPEPPGTGEAQLVATGEPSLAVQRL